MKDISLFGGTGFVGTHFKKVWTDSNIIERERWCRRPAPDTDILWLISTTHNYNVFEDSTLDVNTNLVALTEGLESFRHHNPKGVFNFVSSWFVYGDHGGYPVNELVSCHPKGFYSITKYTAEELIKSYCDTFNLRYRIFRLCNVVGPGDKPTAKKNALQYIIGKMQKNEDIEIYGDGKFYRNYMHVDDVCEAIRLLMLKGQHNSIYNIGHPEHRVFIDHIGYVSALIDYRGKIDFVSPKTFHRQVQTTNFKMDTTKLMLEGFRPKFNLSAMLNDISQCSNYTSS